VGGDGDSGHDAERSPKGPICWTYAAGSRNTAEAGCLTQDMGGKCRMISENAVRQAAHDTAG